MFFEQIQKRRSIRTFTDRKVEKEKVDRLIEAALRSFSSRDIKPWQFVVVNQTELLKKLALAKPHGSSFLKNAPLGIVVCADPSASDVWVEDTAIASTFIHLAAQGLGLGSCWIQIRKRDHSSAKTADAYIKEILHIPENLQVESILAIGYPEEIKQGHAKETLAYDKIFFNQYTPF
ncbi:MAG: nitroreductase family protein [Desulfotignum sp.]|nr:nitroreductase family protein [Desulfotignum sp.]MCF8125299.1 nitroreductase family protein [Desulfotignum sp.]